MNTYYTDAKIEKLEQENARLREVVKMQDEYTSLLVSDLEEVILLAATHGMSIKSYLPYALSGLIESLADNCIIRGQIITTAEDELNMLPTIGTEVK